MGFVLRGRLLARGRSSALPAAAAAAALPPSLGLRASSRLALGLRASSRLAVLLLLRPELLLLLRRRMLMCWLALRAAAAAPGVEPDLQGKAGKGGGGEGRRCFGVWISFAF